MQPQALSNVRVLDLTRVLAGPWCTQILADMGADVIKIEHPARGDDTRQWGPPYAETVMGDVSDDSTYFASANRNKRSVAIDISKPEGVELILSLVRDCDVFVENFKVGDLQRRGLDYESIRKVNPKIIYCSITGYGQDGPYASRPGYDFVFQAEGGLMSITGERDDLPGGGAQKLGIAAADLSTGLYATIAILAALNYRNFSGKGQYIDLALLDCLVGLSSNQGASWLMNGIEPRRWGNAHPSLVPYQVFATLDGSLVIAVGNDAQWARLCRALDDDQLAQDARFHTASGRITGRDQLLPLVSQTIASKSTAHWLEAFTEFDIPHGPINRYSEAFAHPQVVHRQMAVKVPVEGSSESMWGIANPIKFSETPIQYRRAPATLGQHTTEVLDKLLNLHRDSIDALRAGRVIAGDAPNTEITEERND